MTAAFGAVTYLRGDSGGLPKGVCLPMVPNTQSSEMMDERLRSVLATFADAHGLSLSFYHPASWELWQGSPGAPEAPHHNSAAFHLWLLHTGRARIKLEKEEREPESLVRLTISFYKRELTGEDYALLDAILATEKSACSGLDYALVPLEIPHQEIRTIRYVR